MNTLLSHLLYSLCLSLSLCSCLQDIKKKISKCKDEKSVILDLSKCDVSIYTFHSHTLFILNEPHNDIHEILMAMTFTLCIHV